MTSEEFLKGLSGEQLAYAENLQGQRDDALARIAKYDADATDVAAKTKADLAAAKQAGDDALAGLKVAQDRVATLLASLPAVTPADGSPTRTLSLTAPLPIHDLLVKSLIYNRGAPPEGVSDEQWAVVLAQKLLGAEIETAQRKQAHGQIDARTQQDKADADARITANLTVAASLVTAGVS